MSKFHHGLRRAIGCMMLVMALVFGGLIASVISINWSLGWWPIPKGALEVTEQRGNQVVDALKHFRADHGRYPESLQELSPKYLQEILPPTWGLRTWEYTAELDGFDLRVNESVLTGNGVARHLRYYDNCSKWETGD